MQPRHHIDRPALVCALVLIVLAAVVWRDMAGLQLTSTYGVGPKAMPAAIALGLAVLAGAHVFAAFRRDAPAREPADPGAIATIAGALIAATALIAAGAGFIPAATILFAATATAFGRRAILADLAIGLALALLAYFLLVKMLTLSLPVGPLERLL